MDLRELPPHAFARHPWESARADFFVRLLREQLPDREGRAPGRSASARPPLRALDIGAGDGYFAERLLAEVAAIDRVTCLDTGYEPSWLADRRTDGRPIEFTARPPAGEFDLVLLLDVLEHSDDDRALLAQAVASATAGGWLLLTVPAHPRLFSHHDELLGHKRRYAPAALRDLAIQAGLAPMRDGQLFSSLLLPRSLARLGEHLRRDKPTPANGPIETPLGTWHHGAMVTSAVRRLLALDGAVSRWAASWRLPLPGLSTWVLARKR